ncbi:hypothetical protein [Pseudoroseomonas cervicalis]|uniref:hypothetical protein n=1 Tax=Teichococcus cervicalis TaxID=204525 RepID=UPI0022F1B287|nr:hypothetical protein [Pseudoroseomonas cervicalis]WBV41923.1 hypothetical protein PFY06_11815 [Pseudoroseomonas cervicalis]
MTWPAQPRPAAPASGAATPPPRAMLPAVLLRGAAAARLALRAAPAAPAALPFLTPPGAAAWLSPAALLATLAAAAEGLSGAPRPVAILDCGAMPGFALGALGSGVAALVLEPECPAWAQVESAARQAGTPLWRAAPPAFDPGPRLPAPGSAAEAALLARLTLWFTGGPGDSAASLG